MTQPKTVSQKGLQRPDWRTVAKLEREVVEAETTLRNIFRLANLTNRPLHAAFAADLLSRLLAAKPTLQETA
jgi:chromosomal replication initiation ATPase DnaA